MQKGKAFPYASKTLVIFVAPTPKNTGVFSSTSSTGKPRNAQETDEGACGAW